MREKIERIVKNCRYDDFEDFHYFYQVDRKLLKTIFKEKGVTEEEYSNWKEEYESELHARETGGDYNMMHPDETEDDYWSHEE